MLLQASFLQNRIETARSWWQRTWTPVAHGEADDEDEPLRAELFSADQLLEQAL